MLAATADTPVGLLAARWQATVPILERAGIDYACAGQLTLGEAAARVGIPLPRLLDDLDAAVRVSPAAEPDWWQAPLELVVDHVVTVRHARVRALLARACRLAAELDQTTGARHADVPPLRHALEQLRADLLPHLDHEEHALFPQVLAAVDGERVALAPVVRRQIADHQETDDSLHRLRLLAHDYRVAPHGGEARRALYHTLVELEREQHLHVHLETNVVFRRLLEAAADDDEAPTR